MGRKLARISLWFRRRSQLPVVLVAGVVIALLFLNDETSLTRSRALDKEIDALNAEIAQARDSAAYYEAAFRGLQTNAEDLERVARENYNMQRPTEDVYILE